MSDRGINRFQNSAGSLQEAGISTRGRTTETTPVSTPVRTSAGGPDRAAPPKCLQQKKQRQRRSQFSTALGVSGGRTGSCSICVRPQGMSTWSCCIWRVQMARQLWYGSRAACFVHGRSSLSLEDCGAPKQCRQETWLALQRFQNKASPRPRGCLNLWLGCDSLGRVRSAPSVSAISGRDRCRTAFALLHGADTVDTRRCQELADLGGSPASPLVESIPCLRIFAVTFIYSREVS